MRVLLIKTSSMGDIIHTFPAITDAVLHRPELQFDWVVEEGFAQIPKWHPAVRHVFPYALRRMKKNPKLFFSAKEWGVISHIKAEPYDLVIDAQGLIKSAALTLFAKSKRKVGFSFRSAREPLASIFYNQTYVVEKDQHAVTRVRALFAQTFGYPMPTTTANYGLRSQPANPAMALNTPYVLFFHGTTWDNKHWPPEYWRTLATLVAQTGISLYLPWGNALEHERATQIAAGLPNATVLPKLSLSDLVPIIANAKAAVSVDTGLAHLAAALNLPTVSLYGPTDPKKSGAMGEKQIHLAANLPCAPCLKRTCALPLPHQPNPPCFGAYTPTQVFHILKEMLDNDFNHGIQTSNG